MSVPGLREVLLFQFGTKIERYSRHGIATVLTNAFVLRKLSVLNTLR